MTDEIIPSGELQDELRPIEEPESYNPPPLDSLPSLPLPASAGEPPVKLPLFTAIPTPPNELTDRLTVSIQAHHEQWGDEPLSFGCQFHANTEVSDQGLKRKFKIPPDKKVLLRWEGPPDVPGFLMIKNQTGQIQFTRKGKEEVEAIRQQNLLISLCEDCPDDKALIVRPGRGFLAEMQDDTEIWLKSASGICEIVVFVFPR